MALEATDLDRELARMKTLYTQLAGIPDQQAAAKATADSLRAQGANENIANYLAHGNPGGIGATPMDDTTKALYATLDTTKKTTRPTTTDGSTSTSSLYDQIRRLRGVDTQIPVPQAQYQTPAQLTALQTSMLAALQPQIQQQQQAAAESYGQSTDALRNAWAARGLLAGTAPALQEKGLADTLAKTQAGIQATAQADAWNRALQGANLGLTEQQQLFGQQANNRDAAMSQQQAVYNALANALGIDIGQSQFDRNLAENQRQFDATMGENQRQFNYGTALDLSSLYGTGATPSSDLSALFGQFAGKQTQAAKQAKDQTALGWAQENRMWAGQNQSAADAANSAAQKQAQAEASMALGNAIAALKAQKVTRDDAIQYLFNGGGLNNIADAALLDPNAVINMVDKVFGKSSNTIVIPGVDIPQQ